MTTLYRPYLPIAAARMVVLLAALLLLASGCKEQLGPINEPSGFSGVLRFQNWPPADSVREMRLIVFDVVPTDSTRILQSLLVGGAAIWPPAGEQFPMFVDSLTYEFTTRRGTNLKVKNYEYVAIVFQYGQNVLTDWAVAGVFSTSGSPAAPSPLRVLLHRVRQNVDISVDFHNLPTPPWRR